MWHSYIMAKNKNNIVKLLHHAPTSGLVFIGDPHLWSKTPGRRLDNYSQVTLNKLAAAAEISNRLNLWPVCLGDLFHHAKENNLEFLSKIMEVLREFDRPFLCAVGNHDLTERELTKGTALELLEQAGVLRTMRQNGPFGIIEITDEMGGTSNVLLGATPYGENIPPSLSRWTGLTRSVDHNATKKAIGVEHSVWITHDDMAFDHRYPGAKDTHPIVGVDLVINGHMHLAQTPLRKGPTAWYNPGNISRLSIDLSKQTPRIWSWKPDGLTMKASDGLDIPLIEPIDLPHQDSEEVLSLHGRAVKNAILSGEEISTLIVPEEDTLPVSGIASSKFVEKLKDDQSQQRTDDGSYLSQTVQDTLARRQAPEHVSGIVQRLLDRALEKHRNNHE